MSETVFLANLILSMSGTFSIRDINRELEEMGKEVNLSNIIDTLETYIQCGLVNESGFDYEIAS